mgnify:CR=1 FL=1
MTNYSSYYLPWLWLSGLVIALDQISKYLITAWLVPKQVIELLPIFNFTLVYNQGAAFSLLANAGGWQRWFFIGLAGGISIVLVLWLRRLRAGAWLEALALTLILGGALGNLWDRIWLGQVVDFIQFHWHHWYFPAFNIADSAITLGAGLIILDAIYRRSSSDED